MNASLDDLKSIDIDTVTDLEVQNNFGALIEEAREHYYVGCFTGLPTQVRPPRRDYAARLYDQAHMNTILDSMRVAFLHGQCLLVWIYDNVRSIDEGVAPLSFNASVISSLILGIYTVSCCVYAVNDMTSQEQQEWFKRRLLRHMLTSVTGNHFCHASREYWQCNYDKEPLVPMHVYLSTDQVPPGTYPTFSFIRLSVL